MECDWHLGAVRLADLIRAHKGRIIVYTGAGISTSTNIPDYRGTNGLWIRQKRPRQLAPDRLVPPCAGEESSLTNSTPNELIKGVSTKQLSSATLEATVPGRMPVKLRLPEATTAIPTFTHMAVKVLVEQGYVRHVVSQNVDGLHMRSGLPRDKLSELHGNLFLEQCIACHTIVMRNFDVAETTGRGQHLTGRICPQCRILRPGECFLTHRALCSAVEKKLCSSRRAKHSRDAFMLAQKSAATSLSRSAKRRMSHSDDIVPSSASSEAPFQRAPLLRDVVVHFYERQPEAGLSEIYRVSAAIEAVHGRKQLFSSISACLNPGSHPDSSSGESPSKSLISAPWFQRMLPAFRLHSIQNSATGQSPVSTTCDTPASLILVFGSSLLVLRNYGFLWPHGLRRCLSERNRTDSDSSVFPSQPMDDSDEERCHLAIVNLQPTCKDGLADVVIRAPCDQVLEVVMHHCLRLEVPNYSHERDDPLFRNAVSLNADEEHTRTRPNIPFHLYT
ncbi:NAD-dependent deacetylase sirtuin 7 [Paragonimus westermani]|uniref:Regulatory protein SIR2 homolog 7 n=1 Tax=Paragonimus westermani TaxID=34504 RepID=A0A5J4NVB8_9TREM|nr:NAD-dependent deacetylase sirtuin 7 [Paragonimus westermani]